MYTRPQIGFLSGCARGLLCRYLSSAEVSTALRPFYFSVHPDLFGKYPDQQRTNENSLQQLSAVLEAQQANRQVLASNLSFYVRQKDMPEGKFKLINIKLQGNNVRESIIKILQTCDMPTTYVEKIPKEDRRKPNLDFSSIYDDTIEVMKRKERNAKERKLTDNFEFWILEHSNIAKQKYESTMATRDQVNSLINQLCKTYGIKKVKYDSGWNISHIRGSLQSLVNLASQHSQDMENLKGRTIALGQFTGVSLDGDVFLNIVDVRNEWLKLIKKVKQEDSALINIPNYEKTLSSILRNIRIRRRKFMPKVSATKYCNHLSQLITSIGDFYGSGKKIPSEMPQSLKKYELVVEPEAGPLMVSPTGQFITPSSCPAAELISFIANHIDTANLLLTEYNINKHIEKALHKEVKERLGLLELHKDDSVTPALMIVACQRLLHRADIIAEKLRGNILYITHYYSVLSEGALCIPWNFK